MDEDFIQIKETRKERVYDSHNVKDFLRETNRSEFDNVRFMDHLNDELLSFVDFLKPSDEERILRRFMVEKIKNTILEDLFKIKESTGFTGKSPKTTETPPVRTLNILNDTIHSFGSYETDLYLPGSDIDLTLFTDYEDALRKLQYTLADNPLIFSKSIIFLSKARIPILRFMDICHFSYDLCLNQETGLVQAKFIKKVLSENPKIKIFALFLKFFLKSRELNESKRGGLCSYAQLLMICNFISLHPLVQRGLTIKSNFSVLLLDFFQLFGQDFSYSTAQICFDSYKVKDCNNFLSIEDPTNPEHDVGFLASNMSAIKDVFNHAYKIMVAASKERIGNNYTILPLWLKIGDYELSWRENVLQFYEKIIVRNEI